MSIAERYALTVWRSDSLLATWTPDRHLAVGDVVRLSGGGGIEVEERMANLVSDALPNIMRRQGARTTLLQSGVTLQATVGASAPLGAVRIALAGSRSFLFAGGDAMLATFETLSALRTAIGVLSARGRWDPSWHLITTVREHRAGTVVIAESDRVQAEIKVEGSEMVDSLAGIRAGGQVSVTSGRAATFTMGRCTPFYEAIRLRRRWTSGPRVESTSLDDQPPPDGSAGRPRSQDEVVRVGVRDIGLLSETCGR